jgi:hypothetical protein
MRIVLATSMSPDNVNLAFVEGEKIRSDDVLQYRDMSGEIEENQLPIFTEARQAITKPYSGTITEIDIINDIYVPEITSEYNFIKDTAETIPLWHKYDIKIPHYNTSAELKVFTIKNTEVNKEYQILSSKSSVILCKNTIVVKDITNPPVVTLTEDDYIYNSGTRTLKITNSAYNNKKIQINFYVITNSIILKDELGNEIQNKYIRIEPTKYESTPTDTDDKFGPIGPNGDQELLNLYDIEILFANVLEPDLTYTVEYLYYNNSTNETNVSTEVINTIPIYTKVSLVKETDTFEDRVYEVKVADGEITYPIYTKIPTTWPKIFVKYPTDRNNKITIVEPDNIPHNYPWFIQISNEKIIVDNYTYEPIEKATHGFINDQYYIQKSTEPITKLDNNTIKTTYDNLQLSYNSSGKVSNITIINDNIDISDQIEWVDAKRGIIKLSNTLNLSLKNNSIKYDYYLTNVQYKGLNVNPFMIYSNTNDTIIDKFIVIYMMPTEELNESKGRSIFHLTVYKYPERYEDVKDYERNVEDAIKFIKGDGYLGHSFVYDQITEFINSGISRGDDLHPIILGYISAGNISTPSKLQTLDIRRRGGGLAIVDDINELDSDVERHYLDIAKVDGYNYDLSNISIVKVKNRVKTRLENKMRNYDPYAQRQIRDNVPGFNLTSYTESYIESIVRKYLNAACHVTIVYED